MLVVFSCFWHCAHQGISFFQWFYACNQTLQFLIPFDHHSSDIFDRLVICNISTTRSSVAMKFEKSRSSECISERSKNDDDKHPIHSRGFIKFWYVFEWFQNQDRRFLYSSTYDFLHECSCYNTSTMWHRNVSLFSIFLSYSQKFSTSLVNNKR